MKKILTLMAVAGIALGGCAKLPDSIAPTSMVGAYDKVSCTNARTLLTQEQNTLAVLSEQQKAAATTDANGVFLVLIPVSTMTGSNKEGEIASSKGKVAALQARLLTCG